MHINRIYWHCKAIKAIPHEVVFNRKPNHKRTLVGIRAIVENDAEDQVFEDETNHIITDEAIEQEVMEQRAQQQMRALDEEMVTALERTHAMTTDVKEIGEYCTVSSDGGKGLSRKVSKADGKEVPALPEVMQSLFLPIKNETGDVRIK